MGRAASANAWRPRGTLCSFSSPALVPAAIGSELLSLLQSAALASLLIEFVPSTLPIPSDQAVEPDEENLHSFSVLSPLR